MILVTGAGGFIGSRVCRLLSADGHDILALDRSFNRTPLPSRHVEGDLSDKALLARLFAEHSFETVIHLAALLTSASRRDPQEAMRVNIGASLDLLRLAEESTDTEKFIFGSSISAYGPKPYADCGEVSEAEPAAPANVYGVSKRYIEIIGEEFTQQQKLRFIALRIPMVVGAGATNTASSWRSEIFEKLQVGQRVSIDIPHARHERFPLLHVADLAEAIRRLVAAGQAAHTVYNAPADNYQCGDLADTVSALNRNIEFTFSPSNAGGNPDAVAGSRFTQEFGFHPLLVKDRLRGAFEGREQ